MRAILAAQLLAFGVSSALAAPSVDYALAPEMKNGAPVAFDVTIHFIAPKGGKVQLDLPDKGMGTADRWRFISDIVISGAKVTGSKPAMRMLSAAPGAAITISYRVHSAYTADPPAGSNPYLGAVIRPTWFAALGDFVFITPHGWEDVPATFHWGPIPKGWTVASDLEHGTMGRGMTLNDIGESTILGGTDVKIYARRLPDGGTVRLAARGKWSFAPEHFADVIARIVAAQRDFWDDAEGRPFLVSLFQLAGSGSSGGTGRGDAFALYGTSDIDLASFTRTIAHEHMHTWNPDRLGTLPDDPAREPVDFWFSEGFTDFYADRTLLKSGIWSLNDFVNDVNNKLMDYASSPVRNAPNSRIISDFWKNYDVQQLPYRRGMLLAFLWDYRTRKYNGGMIGLDNVMFGVRDRFAAAKPGHKPDVVANFLGTYKDVTGIDLSSDVARYVDKGDTVTLPSDLFGNCATVKTVTAPAFDRGFDADKSAATGFFAGVDPKGPAYAAGIRNGMKRIGYVSGAVGDSRALYSYRVADADGSHPRVIGYYPRGNRNVTFQEIVLAKDAPARSAACVRALTGG